MHNLNNTLVIEVNLLHCPCVLTHMSYSNISPLPISRNQDDPVSGHRTGLLPGIRILTMLLKISSKGSNFSLQCNMCKCHWTI